MASPLDMELFPGRVGLCILDMQERLSAAMPEKVVKGTLRNCLKLIEAARVLELPVVVTEQTPGGLGSSLPVIAESVLRFPEEQVRFVRKHRFSCAESKDLTGWMKRSGRNQWILAGMETHVAVYQSARGLLAAGHAVHVPRDAVVARTLPDWEVGLQLIERAGAVVTCTEAVVFDLVKGADSEAFKVLSKVIR